MRFTIAAAGALAVLAFGVQAEAFARGFGGGRGGAAGGARAYGHRTNYVSSSTMHARAGYVRTGTTYPYFGRGWVAAHPLPWAPVRWAAASYWLTPAWTTVGPWCGITAEPIVYDYGST